MISDTCNIFINFPIHQKNQIKCHNITDLYILIGSGNQVPTSTIMMSNFYRAVGINLYLYLLNLTRELIPYYP